MNALTVEEWKRLLQERMGSKSRPFSESTPETSDHVSDEMGTVLIGENGEFKGWLSVAPCWLRNQER